MADLITTWSGVVEAQWVDYNGHLRDAYYMLLFSFASDGLMERIGLDAAGREATGHTFYSLETHVNYLLEVKESAAIEVRTQILGMDTKRVDVYHALHLLETGALLAANEQMLINIDMKGESGGPKSAPFSAGVRHKLQLLAAAHAQLPRPAYAGRTIALPRAKTPTSTSAG
jgi:acyl-CoA thioester hydrolase